MAIFGLLGPLSAAAPVILLWAFGVWRFGMDAPKDPSQLWSGIVIVTFLAYYVGGAAAVLTGLVMAWLSPGIRGMALWLAGSAALCVILTLTSALIMGGGGDFSEVLHWSYVFVIGGVLGGLTGALATLKLRPGPRP
jgi:hypothetical protein